MNGFEQGGIDYENVFDSSGNVTTDNQDKEMALRDAAAAVSSGDDPFTAYNEAYLAGSAAAAQSAVQEGTLLERQSTAMALEAGVRSQPDEAQELTGIAIDMLQEGNELINTPMGADLVYVKYKLGNSENLSDEELENLAVDHYIRRTLATMADAQSVGDSALDLLGMVAWPDESYNTAAFVSQMRGADGVSVGDWFKSASDMYAFADRFNELSAKQKLQVFARMQEVARDVEDDNLTQQIDMLRKATGIQRSLDYETFEKLFIGIDLATIGSGLLKVAKRVNPVRTMAQQDTGAAAEAVDIAVRTQEGADVVGMSRVDAAMSTVPVNMSDTVAAGSVDDAAWRLNEELRALDDMADEAERVLREGVHLTPDEMDAAFVRAQERLAETPGVSNITPLEITEDGVTFSYKFIDPVTPTATPVELTKTVSYVLDDVTGGFLQPSAGTGSQAFSFVASPNVALGKDKRLLVQPAERALGASAKMSRLFDDSLRLATDKLTTEEYSRVSRILNKGNGVGEYPRDQLMGAGVDGIRLTEREYGAYVKLRSVADNMFNVMNKLKREELDLQNAKSISIGRQTGYSKVYEASEDALKGYRASSNTHVWFPDAPKGVPKVLDDVSPAMLDDLYSRGYKLTRVIDDTHWNAGSTGTRFAVVGPDAIKPLDNLVLNKVPGYIPRVYDNAYWFVKVPRRVNLDGKSVEQLDTVRYFDNKADADKFSAWLSKKDNVKAQVLFDRELTTSSGGDGDVIRMNGGLFRSPRKQEQLKFGLEGAEMDTDPIKALQRYYRTLSTRYPINQLRSSLQRRWMNEAQEFIGTSSGVTFQDARAVIKSHRNIPSGRRNKLLKAHDQINALSRIPTETEQSMQSKLVDMGKWMDAKAPAFLKPLSKYLYRMNHSAPTDAMKAASFNMNLGMWSFAQFPVQLMGITAALTVDPINAAKGMPRAIAFGLLDNIKNPKAYEGAVKALEKIVPDIREAHTAWRRTGYYDSVRFANPDLGSMMDGNPYDASMLQRAWNTRNVFFDMGELANMRVSFATAYSKLSKGKVSDVNLKEMVSRAETYRLHMSRANRADFQKGFSGVVTQFQQINTKFFEALMGKELSVAEKSRLLTGQMTLFGFAGVPVLDIMADRVLDVFLDFEDVTAEQLTLAKRGAMAWLVNSYMDMDTVVTDRVALSGGFLETIIDAATTDVNAVNLMGPFGTTVDRTVTAAKQSMQAVSSAFYADELEAAEVIPRVAAVIAQSWAELPASTRNLMKAYDLQNSKMFFTSKGVPLMQADPDVWDVTSQALGLQSQDMSDMFDLSLDLKGRAKFQKQVPDLVLERAIKMYHQMLRLSLDGSDAAIDYQMAIGTIMSGVKDPIQRRDMLKKFRERLTNPKSKEDRLIREALSSIGKDFDKASVEFNILLKSKHEELVNGE